METRLAEFMRATGDGVEAESILRTCVHCGFCNASCPTYRLLGDERDGPRGRIYLIKQVLEGQPASHRSQRHLDRCLGCRACETACPSGVEYGRLLDIGRAVLEHRVPRRLLERWQRSLLRAILPYPRRFGPLLRCAWTVSAALPGSLRRKLPPRRPVPAWPAVRHPRRMLVLDGCVQAVAAAGINAAAAQVLDRLGISLIPAPGGGCCGALSHHLAVPYEALDFARRNIDAWWPGVEQGVEAIVVTASGCAVMVKDYGRLLHADPAYAAKAERIAAMTRSIGEVLITQDCAPLVRTRPGRVAFHAPCTLQHGQKASGQLEGLLSMLGFKLTPVADAQLCCGSAGSYSILQPALSERLLAAKLAALECGNPQQILTDNIGCLLHLQSATATPVRHWIERLAEDLADPAPGKY